MTQQSRHLDLPRGMHDASPERAEIYYRLRQDWFAACRLAGYQPVEVPPVGFADTFTTGHSAARERTYQFTDRKGRNLALVSDSLPAILRLAHGRGLPEQRLSHCTQVFRYERRPRRAFHQLGILETAPAAPSPAQHRLATARLALTLAGFLQEHVSVQFVLFDPGIWRHIASRAAGERRTDEALNQLRQVPGEQRPAVLQAMGAGPDAVRIAERLLSGGLGHAPFTSDNGLDERIENCKAVVSELRRHGMTAALDFNELHASEFHDGPAFLVRPDDQERLLGDGGSYGRFAQSFLGAPAAVYSTVVGLERLADLSKNATSRAPADIAVLIDPQEATIALAHSICMNLRQHGIRVWDTLLTGPLRQHLRDTARLRIPYSLVIGARELDAENLVVRADDGTHYPVTSPELASWLRRRLGGSQARS